MNGDQIALDVLDKDDGFSPEMVSSPVCHILVEDSLSPEVPAADCWDMVHNSHPGEHGIRS